MRRRIQRRIELRPYQVDGVRNLRLLFRKYRRIVAVSPTGSGKTTIAVALIHRWPKKRVLWLAHRYELIDQAVRDLERAGVPLSDIGILTGPKKANTDARILVASIDMFRRRPAPKVDVIVIDEAHRGMAASYVKLVRRQPQALVLGLTATPKRLDGQALGGKTGVFDHLLVMAETTELQADGYLARIVTYGIPREKARQIVSGVQAGKDYAVGALGKAMSKRALLGDVVSECARLAPGERTLVFAVNRAHGKALLKRFLKAGRRAEYLDGETPEAERRAMVGKGGRLETGETEVIINVDVLTEGFDCAAVSCIVMARPTKSLTRFLQPIGRAARPYGKKKAKFLDHAGNCWRHGLPDSPREWSLEGNERGLGGGDAPVRQCPNPECGAMNPIAARECSECGTVLGPTGRELIERRVQLLLLSADDSDRSRREAVLKRLAEARGLSQEWVAAQLKEAG